MRLSSHDSRLQNLSQPRGRTCDGDITRLALCGASWKVPSLSKLACLRQPTSRSPGSSPSPCCFSQISLPSSTPHPTSPRPTTNPLTPSPTFIRTSSSSPSIPFYDSLSAPTHTPSSPSSSSPSPPPSSSSSSFPPPSSPCSTSSSSSTFFSLSNKRWQRHPLSSSQPHANVIAHAATSHPTHSRKSVIVKSHPSGKEAQSWLTPSQQRVGRAGGRSVRANAGAGAGALNGGAGGLGGRSPEAQDVGSWLSAFWKFLRPHTIRGTILGTTALTTRALLESPALIDWGLLPKALMGLLALLCGNGFIVGINQIYDVDIDQVNKPFLPVASGELSSGMAWALCLLLAGGGMGLVAANFGTLISGLYGFGLILGTVYSVPPLRLKRFAVPAFLIIATVRGFLLNFGVYYSTRAALGAGFVWSPPITFITCFVTMFAVVIAITKDLPDVDGDRANGIETFATRMGVQAVSLGAVSLLMANYCGAMWMALQPSMGFNPAVMFSAHAALALLLAARTWALHKAGYHRESILAFYRWIWTLFYCEYAMFPFI